MQPYRIKALAALGNKCMKCGFDDPRALHFDHILGNNRARHRRKLTPNYRTCDEIKRRLKNGTLVSTYQLLCANCHAIKTHENKEYNHLAANGKKPTLPLFEGLAHEQPSTHSPHHCSGGIGGSGLTSSIHEFSNY